MNTSTQNKPHVLGIVGATASAKTTLSLPLAQALNCEIVCMDSMQIYRRMDIGTAKPTADERALIPHHMLDIVEPTEPFSVAQYVEQARAVITDIVHRGRVPMLVGGTGLYLQGLTLPIDIFFRALAQDAGPRAVAIVLSGSTPRLSDTLLRQLKVGGRLIAVVGEAPVMVMQLVTRTGEDSFTTANVLETLLAPLLNAPKRSKFVF